MAQVSGCTRTVAQLNQITGCTDFDGSFLLLIVDTINGETMNIPVQTMFDCMGDDNYYLTGGTYSGGYIWFSGIGTNFSVDVSALLDDTNTYVTGATLSADTLVITRNDGYTMYVDLSKYNYDDEIAFLQSEIDYHTGDTNNPHQTSFYNLTQTAHTHTLSEIIDYVAPFDTYLSAGTYSGGYIWFSGHGIDFSVDVTALLDDTNTYVTGATLSGNTLILERNDGINIYTDLSSLVFPAFSGGSGSCITDLYVTNIHGCSPVTLWNGFKSPDALAVSENSFAFGPNAVATGNTSFVFGSNCQALEFAAFAIGAFNTAFNLGSLATGGYTNAYGNASATFGYLTSAYNTGAVAFNRETTAIGEHSAVFGYSGQSIGKYSFVTGWDNEAHGYCSFTEGGMIIGRSGDPKPEPNYAIGNNSHAGGHDCVASGNSSYAFGHKSWAVGGNSRALGYQTFALGDESIAINYSTQAIGNSSFASGFFTKAVGLASHTGGWSDSTSNYITASGKGSFNHSNYSTLLHIGLLVSGATGDFSAILGGDAQSVTGQFSFIGGGQINSIWGGMYSAIIGGGYNTINNSFYSTIIGGRYHNLLNGSDSFIIGGEFHDLQNSYQSSIVGGDSNTILSDYYGSILGGKSNKLSNDWYCSIVGGENNNIGNHKWAGIFAGSGNTIDAPFIANICETIIGGYDNYIDSSAYSSIIGGYNNRMTNLQNGNIITSKDCIISGNNDCALSTIICSDDCEIINPSFMSYNFYLGGRRGSVYNSSRIGHIITDYTTINNATYVFLLNSTNIDGYGVNDVTVINTSNLYLDGVSDSFISNSFNITLTGETGKQVSNTNIIGCQELNLTGPLVNSVLLGISGGTITPVSDTTYVENLNIHTQPQNDDTATPIGITSDGFVVKMSGNNSTLGEILYFAPEYPNAVFNQTDGSNQLTVIPKFDSTNFQNYYELKPASGSTGDQEIDIFLQLMVPLNFTSWNNSDISFKYWFSGGTLGNYDLQVYDTTNTSDFSVSGFINSGSTWSTATFDTMNGTYTPGQPFIVRIRPIVEQAQEIRLGAIRMRYNT